MNLVNSLYQSINFTRVIDNIFGESLGYDQFVAYGKHNWFYFLFIFSIIFIPFLLLLNHQYNHRLKVFHKDAKFIRKCVLFLGIFIIGLFSYKKMDQKSIDKQIDYLNRMRTEIDLDLIKNDRDFFTSYDKFRLYYVFHKEKIDSILKTDKDSMRWFRIKTDLKKFQENYSLHPNYDKVWSEEYRDFLNQLN